jgi:general secretion pathway protein D
MKIYTIVIFAILSSTYLFPQEGLEKRLSGQYSPLELVSISKYVNYDQAIKMLSAVSELVTGKSIVSTVIVPSPINVEIINMPYLDALNLLVNIFDLTYEAKESSIIIKEKSIRIDDEFPPEIWADIDARDIKISAIFFEADIANSRQVGIDWSVLLNNGNGVSIGSELRTETILDEEIYGRILKKSGSSSNVIEQPGFGMGTLTQFTSGNFTGTATALFRFFESNNLGEIISSPHIVVRDGQQGRIQIGEDFSVNQKDFSGNTIEKFYSAGTIIEVTPYVYNKNDIDYILAKLNVERSSFLPTEQSTQTIVKKTQATSDVLMLDGEETIIGGLYVNDETTVRNGIPILKDLPWWVFGIRYLTGSDQVVVRKKEVIIVIRIELLPTLEERFAKKELKNKNLIRDKIMDDRIELNEIKPNYIEKEK